MFHIGYSSRRGPESRGFLQICRSLSAAATCLSRRAGDLGSTPRPTHPPPAAAGAGGCALEARGKRCASPTRRASSHWAGAPHLLPAARRRRRSQGREEGAVAPAFAARSSPAHGRAACARSRGGRPAPLLPSGSAAANTASSQLPAPDGRRHRRRTEWHGLARTAAPRRPTRKLFSRKPEAGLGA